MTQVKRILAQLYKQVHPDVTRHLQGTRCQQNSIAMAELNSYFDKMNKHAQQTITDAKTLVFHKTNDTTITITLPKLHAQANTKQVLQDIIAQLDTQKQQHNHTAILPSPWRSRDGDVGSHAPVETSDHPTTIRTPRNAKREILKTLYREALQYLIEGKDCDTEEMKTCSQLYKLGIDPRLIFFQKTLSQQQRKHAIETLAAVARDMEVPRMPIVVTQNVQHYRNTQHVIEVAYDLDTRQLRKLIKDQATRSGHATPSNDDDTLCTRKTES